MRKIVFLVIVLAISFALCSLGYYYSFRPIKIEMTYEELSYFEQEKPVNTRYQIKLLNKPWNFKQVADTLLDYFPFFVWYRGNEQKLLALLKEQNPGDNLKKNGVLKLELYVIKRCGSGVH